MNQEAAKILSEARKKRGLKQVDMAAKIAEELDQTYSSRQYQRLEEGIFPKYKTEIIKAADKILGTNLYDIIYDKVVPHETGTAEAKPRNYLIDRRNQKVISKPFLVPLVPFKARAGYIKSYDQVDYLNELEQYAIPPNVDPTAAIWRYFEVGGDSMEPTLVSGDMLLCSQVPPEDWTNIRNFYIYVIVTENELLVKRVVVDRNDFILLSENEEQYPPDVKAIKEIKQLWVVRRHIKRELPPPKMFDMDKVRKNLKRS